MTGEESPTEPHFDACPTEGCEETEDLMVQECAPGHSWMFTCGQGHWGFIHKKTDKQESEQR